MFSSCHLQTLHIRLTTQPTAVVHQRHICHYGMVLGGFYVILLEKVQISEVVSLLGAS